jgi:teichuronic acid biosynthesis glycosyltransferase TuaH
MSKSKVLVYFAGGLWDDVSGTDKHLVTALGQVTPVLWVDPPTSVLNPNARTGGANLVDVAAGVVRLRVIAPPGVTRPGVRTISRAIAHGAVRLALRRMGAEAEAVIVATPSGRFGRNRAAVRALYLTDDWPAGANLMALSATNIEKLLRRNIQDADVVAAVSPDLVSQIENYGRQGHLVPNGCQTDTANGGPKLAERPVVAGLVGQLNERLDLGLLEGLVSAGLPLTVIGPRTERHPDTSQRLDRILHAPSVKWLGRLSSSEVTEQLQSVRVGLTPYADTPFNRASFPLKTLEYLAAGLPVVATDSPAVRWLNSPDVSVGTGTDDFVSRVFGKLAEPGGEHEYHRRIRFAEAHSWSSRARTMLDLLQG